MAKKDKKHKKHKKPKQRIHETKWRALNARGFTCPVSVEENRMRLREAHHVR